MTTRALPILTGGSACVVSYALISRTGDLDRHRAVLIIVVLAAWLVFALAAWVALRARTDISPGLDMSPGSGRRRLVLVVLIAACCQLPGVLVAPQSSSDAYRYVWDGRVQLSGTSPYRYVPLDDRLAALRDPLLFPGLTPSQSSGVHTPDRLPKQRQQISALAQNDPRTRINRPKVPTIYPPVAQAWFTVVAWLTPWSWGTRGVQIGAALLAIGLTGLLGLLIGRRGRDPALALGWGWCPLVVLEAGNGAHVDVLAAVLVVAAFALLGGRPGSRKAGARDWSARLTGGVLLGLAAATKIIPLLLLPAVTVLRRRHGGGPRQLAVPVTAIGSFALSYLPHLLVVGSLVIGYLPDYLNEEGFSDGNRYGVLGLVLPPALRQSAGLALAVVLGLYALWRCDVERPERTGVWLFGAAVLISTPSYQWYCLPLVALAVLAGRWEWMAVAVAGYVSYAGHGGGKIPGLAYGVAGLVVLLISYGRARPLSRRADGAFRGIPVVDAMPVGQ